MAKGSFGWLGSGDILGDTASPLDAVDTLMTWLPEVSTGRRRKLLDAIIAAASKHEPFDLVYDKPDRPHHLTFNIEDLDAVCRGIIDHTDAGVRRTFANRLAVVDWDGAMPLLGYLSGDADTGVRQRAYVGVKRHDLPLSWLLKTFDARPSSPAVAEPVPALPDAASDRTLPDIGTAGLRSAIPGLESLGTEQPSGQPFTKVRRRTVLGYSADAAVRSRGELTLQLRVEGAEDVARSLDIRVPTGKDHATLLMHASSQSATLKVGPEIQTVTVPRNADSNEVRLQITALHAGDGEVAITMFDEYRLIGSIAVTFRAEVRDGKLVLEKLRDVLFRDAGDSEAASPLGPTIQLSLTNEPKARIQFHMPALNEQGQLELVPLGYSRDGFDTFAVLKALAATSKRIDSIEQSLGNPGAVGVETDDQVLQLLAMDFHGIAREIVDNLMSLQTRTVLARLDANAVVQWVIKSPDLDAVPWELAFQAAAQSTLKEPILLVRIPVRDDTELAASPGTPRAVATVLPAQTTRRLVYVVGEGVVTGDTIPASVIEVVKVAGEKGFDVIPNVVNGFRQPMNLLKLKDSFSQADIIHLLCHGIVESEGSLYLKIENNPGGQLQPHHVRTFVLPKRPLVFVNACSSAAATFGTVGFTNFARNFLAAGASAYIGTLAPVVTPTALRFATAFFEGLVGKGLSIAGAMNSAHEAMAGDADPTWRLYAVYGDLSVARGALS
jgi:hypothetical protein